MFVAVTESNKGLEKPPEPVVFDDLKVSLLEQGFPLRHTKKQPEIVYTPRGEKLLCSRYGWIREALVLTVYSWSAWV
jgi:hypothetical protein